MPLMAAGFMANATALETNENFGLLLSYVKQINSHAQSVYLDAIIQSTSLETGRPLRPASEVKFWGEGVRYRYESRMPQSGGEMDFDITYSGSNYAIKSLKAKSLSLSTNDSDIIPVPRNPLLLPVIFLSRESDSCPGCQLKPSELLDTKDLLRRINILGLQENANNLEFLLGGEIIDKRKCNWRVVYSKTNQTVPIAIRQETSDGTFIGEYTFPSLHTLALDGKNSLWPKTVEYIGVEGVPLQKYKVSYEVRKFDLGLEMPIDTFFQRTNGVQIIMDADIQRVLIRDKGYALDNQNQRIWVRIFFAFSLAAALFLLMKLRKS